MSEEEFSSANDAKAGFDSIYNRPDPRAYFSTLSNHGYIIPQEAKPIFEATLASLRKVRDLPNSTTKVVDLGCSYGVNAALLKFDLSMDDLVDQYLDPELSEMEIAEVSSKVRAWLDRHTENPHLEIVGLDPAERAVEYAERVGLLDQGIAADLENGPPPRNAREKLRGTDAIISTGCVGYVGAPTFERLLEASDADQHPWVASFVLRMFPYDEIESCLEDFGLVTEKLEGRTFIQRRFVSTEEKEQVLGRLEELGVDPTGKESEGHYHAEFYLSRPRREVDRTSLRDIVEGL